MDRTTDVYIKPPMEGKRMDKLMITVDEQDRVKVYMNGNEVQGIRRIKFEKSMDEIAVHEIEYVTCRAEHVEATKPKFNVGDMTVKVDVDASQLSNAIDAMRKKYGNVVTS